MSLNRLFRLISIALLLLFMTLAASLVAIEWGAYQRGAHSVQALSNFRLALITLEKVANERGPANAYMGVETAVNQVWRDELQRTRHDSDQAINQLIKALQADPDPRHPAVIEKVMILQRTLGPARLAIDRIAGQDRGQRDSAYIISAVDGMVDAIPLMVRVLADLAEIANQADPELRDGLSSVRVAASLREYAGQLGSLYTAPIVTRRPLFLHVADASDPQARGAAAG
ncbi:hypothetical protein [Herbaspirillum lusitanum]|uniref:hypothetical protein n=1 Tax=Herbaspirillum lusitanum TaxID=213312 RepID=UPI0038B95255